MASSKYEVILQQDVANLGKSGEVVRVRPGYARNFLVPQHLAVPASSQNKALVEHQKRVALARAAKDLAKRWTLSCQALPTTAMVGRMPLPLRGREFARSAIDFLTLPIPFC